jgi:hypothetical protein
MFDGFADFDAAVRDPADPARIAAAYDSGDHLHPNDAGMKAFARAVDPRTLGAARDCPTADVRIGPDKVTVRPGTPVQVTTTVTATTRVTHVRTALRPPTGWTAVPDGQAVVPVLEAGASTSVKWTLTAPADTAWDTREVRAETTFHTAGRTERVSDGIDATVVPTPNGVRAPYLTHATTDGQYAQNGEQFAIWAGGRDLSGWVDEKAAVYRHGVLGPAGTVTARVVSQQGSGPSAKAGLVVANDLTAPEKGGYAVLTMSAQNGLEFMTDSDGDGRLDTWAGGGSSYHPAWLRLTRSGTAYTAYASADGTTWQRVGEATVASASGTGDAGMAASAVNLNYPGQTTQAIFDHFDVTQ